MTVLTRDESLAGTYTVTIEIYLVDYPYDSELLPIQSTFEVHLVKPKPEPESPTLSKSVEELTLDQERDQDGLELNVELEVGEAWRFRLPQKYQQQSFSSMNETITQGKA